MGKTKGSGQGSIYKYRGGWRGQFTIGNKRISKTAKTKKEIIDWIAQCRVDYSQNKYIYYNNITVQQLAEEWFNNKVSNSVSQQTLYKTEALFKVHLYPYLGNIRVQDLTSALIQSKYNEMFKEKNKRGDKYCDSTIKLFASKFKALLNYAVDENIIQNNPHNKVVLPKNNPSKKVSAYTIQEQKIIVDYTKNGSNMDKLFYLLISTGLRIGEVLALTWNDVNFDTGTITINKTAVNLQGKMIIQDHPKTAKSERTVFLSKNTLEVLNNMENVGNRIFENANGNIYHMPALRLHWIRTCKKLGIEYRGIHALRHTWATRALEKGIDIKTVSDLLGHTSVLTTMNIYQDVYSEHKQKAAQIMNDVV